MSKRTLKVALGVLSGIGAGLWLAGCGGDTDGGRAGDQSFDGTSYSSTNAGTIELEVLDNHLSVSEISGFSVRVRDEDNLPVPSVEIACDTETGVALVEPSTGFELTDSNGQVSGKIGCVRPGSYQMACRVPAGLRRVFANIYCSGPVPAGFSGFPGAGGGTLGTGSPTGGSSDVPTSGDLSITGILPFENGSARTLSIDVTQGTCGTGATATPEKFFDTYFEITIANNTGGPVTFSRYSYSIDDADGEGTPVQSDELAFSQGARIDANSTGALLGGFLKAQSGGKFYVGDPNGTQVPSSLGFRNVTVTLIGTDSLGGQVRLQFTVGMVFGNYLNC